MPHAYQDELTNQSSFYLTFIAEEQQEAGQVAQSHQASEYLLWIMNEN